MEAAHEDNASKRVKQVQGTFVAAFALVVHEDARTRDVDGGSNIPQMEADYPAVTTRKKIDGGKTREGT